MKRQPSVISLFSGAGCFDYGFEAAGYKTLFTTDIAADACMTISISRPKWINWNCDITEINGKDILTTTRLKKYETDVLIGGPPCQPFSKSVYGSLGKDNSKNDPRSKLFLQYLRILEDLCPKVFVIENVPQFITGGNELNLKILQKEINRINKNNKSNYTLSIEIINMANYGVPQLRNRLFIVGSRTGKKFHWPIPTHLNNSDHNLGILPLRTAREVFFDLSHTKAELIELEFKGQYSQYLKTIPPGMNYLWHSELYGRNKFKSRARFWNFLLKLSPDLPSWTITAKPGNSIGPFHWDSRRLSNRELARLQTIPDDVEFFGTSINSPRIQIGNGVPSLIGELLGNEIKMQLLGFRKQSYKLKLLSFKGKKKSAQELSL